MEHIFDTPAPVRLYAEVGRGSVILHTGDVGETVVEVTGDHPEEVRVTQEGDELRVVAPRHGVGFLTRDPSVHVRAVVPQESHCTVRTGSADVTAAGTWGDAHVRSGSGDVRLDTVRGPVSAETGSGAVAISHAGSEVRVKSGSGDVVVERVAGEFGISTGSGDITMRHADHAGVLKAGSGGIRVSRILADLTLSTGSGDVVVEALEQGSVQARTASGDIYVGVAPDLAVWTDISTSSGEIQSDLSGGGEPAAGAPFVEVRAKTASGDVVLRQP